jgi:hypothetical protein
MRNDFSIEKMFQFKKMIFLRREFDYEKARYTYCYMCRGYFWL